MHVGALAFDLHLPEVHSLKEKRAVIRPEVQKILDRLDKVPIDIEPRYLTARKLLSGG